MKNTILDYVRETVKNFPEKQAVIDERESISFAELHGRSLGTATAILEKTNMRKSPILVYLPKSTMSIVAFVGILYSGNFYTPTDVRFPVDKALSVITTVNPVLIITNEKYARVLVENGISQDILLNVDDIEFHHEYKEPPASKRIIDSDPAYTFFTSGSTGAPKGVTITHLNVIKHLEWYISTFNVDSKTIIGNQGAFYFDLSTPDVYSCLFAGATLVIIPEKLFAFPAALLEFLKKNNVNFLYWVPSAYSNIANLQLLDKVDVSCIKKMLFNGEAMPTKTMNYWMESLDTLELVANLYGPTEATVACSCYIVDREFEDSEPLPIGFPCANVELLLFDENGHLVEESNTLGEIHIRGTCLSVGYWNDFEKTDNMFIQNPLNPYYHEKIYKTGDLAYYNGRREMIFAGRKDSQIKHLGYRIELGEIESAAYAINAISQACSLYDASTKSIYLFYVSKHYISEEEIRKRLEKKLPRYMVPVKYIPLEQLPHNANGKINRLELANKHFK